MRLLLFNLTTDESDPVLGFACDWVRELAARCEYVDVITMYRGAYQLPPNVRVFSAGRELGLSKLLRAGRFYRRLLRLLRERRYDACFAHMMPLFAGMAGPLLSAQGIPTTLWYTHRARSAQLRWGLAMSRRAVSADETSFPYRSDKLRVIGHGIDCDFYAPFPHPKSLPQKGGVTLPLAQAPQSLIRPGDMPAIDATGTGAGAGGNRLIVQVARLAAVKHQATTIQAVAGIEARLALVGGAQPGAPRAYDGELRAQIQRLGIAERCRLVGDAPAAEVRRWYLQASVAVNMSPVGLFDKAALESMACGVPTVVCNPAFSPLLGEYASRLLTAGPQDVRGLRERLAHLIEMPSAERAAIGAVLRANVLREHSLPAMVERLMAVLRTGELAADA